jgi:hypothetical protein
MSDRRQPAVIKQRDDGLPQVVRRVNVLDPDDRAESRVHDGTPT